MTFWIWVWKSFTRGLNPIYMDSLDAEGWKNVEAATMEGARQAMGQTRRFSEKMNLAAMTPQPKLASTRYCLANPGKEYLVYQPKPGEAFSVNLKRGAYHCEWFDPVKGVPTDGEPIESHGGAQEFKLPFDTDAVLYLKAE